MSSAEQAGFSGLDHVTLCVSDLAEATADYAALFGVSPVHRSKHPALGTEASIFALGNGALELIAPDGAAPEAEGMRAALAAQGEGFLSLSFCAPDAALAQRTLRERGLRVAPPEDGEAQNADGTLRRYRTLEVSPRSSRGVSIFGVEREELADLRREVADPCAAHAFDHVALRTSEPDAVRALYGPNGFGLRLALDTQFKGLRMLFFRTGGVTVEFVTDPSCGPVDKFYGLAFRVRDLDGAHARLAASGFVLSEVRAGNKPGTRVFTVKSRTHGVPTLFLEDPARDAK